MHGIKPRSKKRILLDYFLAITIIYPIVINFVYGYRWYKWAFYSPQTINDDRRIAKIKAQQNIDYALWTTIDKETFKLKVSHGVIIIGKVFIADPKNKNFVFIHHGWTGSMETNLNFAEPYLKAGINVVVYNSRGQNGIDGKLSLGFHESEDLFIIIQHFMKKLDIEKFGIAGISMGAATVLRYAIQYHNVLRPEFVVFDSGYVNLKHQVKHVLKHYFRYPVFCSYYGATIITWLKEGFLLGTFNKVKEIKKLGKIPFLIIHSHQDLFVPMRHSQLLNKHHDGKSIKLFVKKGSHGTALDKYTKEYINAINEILETSNFNKKIK